MYIAFSLAIISGIVLGMLIRDKTRLLRAGGLNGKGEEIYPYVEPYIKRLLAAFDNLLVNLSRNFVHMLLIGLKRFTPWFHRWSQSVESKLLRVIATIKGRGIIRERGAASMFIADLVQNKEATNKKRPTI